MDIYITILVTSDKVDRPQMEKLLNVYPEGNSKSSSFLCSIKENDPRIPRIISLLTDWGMTPSDSSGSLRLPNHFYYAIGRVYDAADYDSSQYLVPLGRPFTELGAHACCDDSGQYRIPRRYFKQKKFMDWLSHEILLVSNDVKIEIETSKMRGLSYQMILPRKQSISEQTPLWMLTSTERMPPMSNACTFYNRHGQRVVGSNSTGYDYSDGFYQPPEYRYKSSDVVGNVDVDMALTYELIGIDRPTREMVVSSRFYQLCKSLNLNQNWIPVRIDPD